MREGGGEVEGLFRFIVIIVSFELVCFGGKEDGMG